MHLAGMIAQQTIPIPDAEAIATKGTPYVLAVCVIALSAALVWVFRMYRADLKEKRDEFVAEVDALARLHDAAEVRWRADLKAQAESFMVALKEQRGEFHTSLKEVVAEMKDGMRGITQRLERIEDSLDPGLPREFK